MYILNFIYFLAITWFGAKFLFSSGRECTNPLNKEQSLLLNGTETFWILTFSTGLLALSAPIGLDLMAVRLFVLEIFCFIGIFRAPGRTVWSTPLVIYVIYLVWIGIGCLYSPVPMYGFRVILKYIYPLLIALFASVAVRNKEVFIKAGLGARWIAVISVIVSFVPYVSLLLPGVFWYNTAKAINYISICIFSMVLFYYTDEKKKNLFFTILFMLPCVLWVFRTSIMGTTLALMTFALFKYRLKAIPIILGALFVFIIAVFAIPSIKEKMFFKEVDNANVEALQSGQISADNVNSNGRFAMWKWSLNKFYKDKKLVGSGTGNLQETFYALRHPFGSIKIIHCDYVQMLCDNGLIGLLLFMGCFILIIFHSFIVFQNPLFDTAIHMSAIVSGATTAGILLTMLTDNVINYSMATLSYPCGFYGMMLGLIAGFRGEEGNAI